MKEDKLPESDISINESPTFKKLDNFWYHNKWKVIISLFFILVLTVCVLQTCEKREYKAEIVFGGKCKLDKAQMTGLRSALSRLVNDGEADPELVYVYEYEIFSEEELKKTNEEYNRLLKEAGGDISAVVGGYYVDPTRNTSEYKAYNNMTMTGEALVYIVSPFLYDSLKSANRLVDLSGIYDDMPDGAVDNFGIKYSSTDLYDRYTGARVFPEDSIICLLKPTVVSQKNKPEAYKEAEKLFKSIVG